MQAKHMLIPYVPMLVPPKRWKGYALKNSFLFCSRFYPLMNHALLLRTTH